MKGFLKYIGLFFLPILLLLTVMELMLRTIPNNYKIKSNYIENHSEDIETLILGNSHTYYGLNPEWIDGKTFNMSNVSQSLDIDLEILGHYLPKMSQLETVVMRLSYDSMFEILSETDEHWRYKDYALYTQIPLKFNLKHHSEILSIGFKENLKRLYKYYLKKEVSVTCNAFGWGTDAMSIHAKDLHKTGKLVAQKHTAQSMHLYETNFQTLNKIAELCQKYDLDLYLITPPGFESYYLNLNYQQLDATITAGQQLAQQYSNVHYYSFLENWRFDSEHFFDADHLNENGAELFSEMINDIIHK